MNLKGSKSGTGAVRAGKWFTLIISNEGTDDIIEISESLENSGLLIDCATETVKHEIKKSKKADFLAVMGLMAALLIAPMASSLIEPVISSLINYITGKGKGQKGGFLPLLAYSGEKSCSNQKKI